MDFNTDCALEVFYSPACNYSQAVLIALHEKRLTFIGHSVDVEDKIDIRQLGSLSPFAELPIIKIATDPVKVLHQHATIIEHLDALFPYSTCLVHADNLEQAMHIRATERDIDSYYTQSLLAYKQETSKFLPQQDQVYLATLKQRIDASVAILDKTLEKNHWIAGESFTMADCSLIPSLALATTLMPFTDAKHLCRYWFQAIRRGSYKKVINQELEMTATEHLDLQSNHKLKKVMPQ
ncbi:glutathione S-transferase family protein [Paraferrimonas sp. SM1919]|uniref:glutathione S-transferase family protein n=1 Tax=Paraferrimonas sp. SM1919 TaxID=2662263 RepID=UPI0013D2465E|nr:glutathione S-transferase family protein [Paraferrimonas sp. SM1919]